MGRLWDRQGQGEALATYHDIQHRVHQDFSFGASGKDAEVRSDMEKMPCEDPWCGLACSMSVLKPPRSNVMHGFILLQQALSMILAK